MKWMAMLLASLLLLVSAAAAADDSETKAREYFKAASAHFDAGRYVDAQAEFAAGYELSRKPGFLWNMAECARLLGNTARAAELYKQYLATAPPNAPQRTMAEARIAEIDSQKAGPAPATAPPASAAAPAAAPPAPASPAAVPSSVVPPVAASPRDPLAAPPPATAPAQTAPANALRFDPPSPREDATPVTGRWWFWTGLAVVAAAATVTGVALTSSHAPPSSPAGTYTIHWN
jgi:hypothetical protein